MSESWTLAELVDEVAARLAQLPTPKNGQIRAVPDDRTIRYYATIGLLDRPGMRGRTALYGARQLAQVVAIKRLQAAGKSLAEIQALWSQLTDETLMSLSGVPLVTRGRAPARKAFWKREPAPMAAAVPSPVAAPGAVPVPMAASGAVPVPMAASGAVPVPVPALAQRQPLAPAELRVQIAPDVFLTIALPDHGSAIALTHADVRAIRAAAAPLVAELAHRRLTPHAGEEEP